MPFFQYIQNCRRDSDFSFVYELPVTSIYTLQQRCIITENQLIKSRNKNTRCDYEAYRISFHHLRNGNRRRSTALVSLSGHNLVVELTQIHAKSCPGVEMIGGGDSSTNTSALADGPVLVEGRSALNRRLIDLLMFVDVICGSVTCNSSHVGHTRSWIVTAIGFQDVVFNKWVFSPAVH